MKQLDMETRILRLECLENLAPVPKGWNITPARVKRLRDITGAGMHTCRKWLIMSCGDWNEHEPEYRQSKPFSGQDANGVPIGQNRPMGT